jgi:hypothetical protein
MSGESGEMLKDGVHFRVISLFIYGLFKDAVSSSVYIASNGRMNSK